MSQPLIVLIDLTYIHMICLKYMHLEGTNVTATNAAIIPYAGEIVKCQCYGYICFNYSMRR